MMRIVNVIAILAYFFIVMKLYYGDTVKGNWIIITDLHLIPLPAVVLPLQ